jgi:hypothetical protein
MFAEIYDKVISVSNVVSVMRLALQKFILYLQEMNIKASEVT